MLLMDHLPECPAPLCDYLDPKGKCMGYEDCEHLCCCAALRACEQRVLDAAREAIAGLPVAISSYYPDDSLRDVGFWRSSALAAIDALKETNVNT